MAIYKFVDPQGVRALIADVRDDVPVIELISFLHAPMRLDKRDMRGVELIYLLTYQGRFLSGHETLRSAGIPAGETIDVIGLSTDLGGIRTPPELNDADFWKEAVRHHYKYSIVGLIFGSIAIIAGITVLLLSASTIGSRTSISLGIASLTVGILIVYITRYSVESTPQEEEHRNPKLVKGENYWTEAACSTVHSAHTLIEPRPIEAEVVARTGHHALTDEERTIHPVKQSTVFISYSHDSIEHGQNVHTLADRLRTEGIDCVIDQYISTPAEGWPRWMMNQVEQSDFVLVVATETYNRRYRGHEEPTKGFGSQWEGSIITQELYDANGKNLKFVPIVFDNSDIVHIPLPLKSATFYNVTENAPYDELYYYLTHQPPYIPQIGAIRQRPQNPH